MQTKTNTTNKLNKKTKKTATFNNKKTHTKYKRATQINKTTHKTQHNEKYKQIKRTT